MNAASCHCIGGSVVKIGPKTLTWECSRCGRRRRWKRNEITVIDLRENADDDFTATAAVARIGNAGA